MMSTETQRNSDRKFLPILRNLVFPNESGKALLTVKQLAAETGIVDKTLYAKLDGTSPFSIEEAFRVAGVYAKHNEWILARLILPEGYYIAHHECTCVNGSLDDESKDLFRAVGDVITEFDKGDKRAALRKLPHVKDVVSRMEREVVA